MTKREAEIIETIAALPEADRRRLVQFLADANLEAPNFLPSMTLEQRSQLQEGIGQAKRGEFRSSADVYATLKQDLVARSR